MQPSTVHLKKNFNKREFKIGASFLKMACWHVTNLLFFRSGIIPFSNILVFILKVYGAKIGHNVRIKPHISIKYPWKLIIGNNCWLADCIIDNLDYITLGNNVCISQQALILTGNHNYKASLFDLITLPVTLKEGVWIGSRAIVCPGVLANSHAVLTGGSVITKDMEPYSIYQGNPAIKTRTRHVNKL